MLLGNPRGPPAARRRYHHPGSRDNGFGRRRTGRFGFRDTGPSEGTTGSGSTGGGSRSIRARSTGTRAVQPSGEHRVTALCDRHVKLVLSGPPIDAPREGVAVRSTWSCWSASSASVRRDQSRFSRSETSLHEHQFELNGASGPQYRRSLRLESARRLRVRVERERGTSIPGGAGGDGPPALSLAVPTIDAHPRSVNDCSVPHPTRWTAIRLGNRVHCRRF